MSHIKQSLFYFAVFICLYAGAGRAHAAGKATPGSFRRAGSLIITGSSTMCPMIADIGRHFQSLHSEVRIEVQCGGSDRGIKDIREGKSDIGMVSRALSGKEKDLYGFPMARDGVSLILNRNNPLKSLSNAQVVGIFTGRITNWRQAGGPDAPVSVYLRARGKPATELFNTYYNLREDGPGHVIAGDNPATITAVASDRNAVGYVSSGEAGRKANSGVPIKILPVNNVMPTNRNIITGNYPIARPLTLATRGLPSGMAKEFINYCLSSKVVDIIERYDFVPYED